MDGYDSQDEVWSANLNGTCEYCEEDGPIVIMRSEHIICLACLKDVCGSERFMDDAGSEIEELKDRERSDRWAFEITHIPSTPHSPDKDKTIGEYRTWKAYAILPVEVWRELNVKYPGNKHIDLWRLEPGRTKKRGPPLDFIRN